MALSAAALVSSNCGALAPIPPHFPVPSPATTVPVVGLRCTPPPSLTGASAAAAPRSLIKVVPFDPVWSSWPDRTGAFHDASPIVGIASAAIRAQDATPRWTEDQQHLMSKAEADAAPSPVRVGGDYWRDTRFSIGTADSAFWASSGFKSGAAADPLPQRTTDAATGTLTSSPFPLSGPYLRLYVGGDVDQDPAVGVELHGRPRAGTDLAGCPPPPDASRLGAPPKGFSLVYARVGDPRTPKAPEREHMRALEVPLAAPRCDLRGLDAVVRVVDASPSGHINVGAIGLADAPLTPADVDGSVPVWGLADYHTHPTDYLSFGGLQGIHTIWGAPGGSMREYVGDHARVKHALASDIPPCDDPSLAYSGHHGGLAAPIMINAGEGRLAPSEEDLAMGAIAFKHASDGGPSFAQFPDFRAGSHEQYHVTQIHRAYLGGLRLMSAMAVHNQGLEYGMGWVRCGDHGAPTVDTTPDWEIIRAHVRAMRQLAELNHDWMEIAYSPADARRGSSARTSLRGRPRRRGAAAPGSTRTAIRRRRSTSLEALGVRQVILVHAMDNYLGGTAVFEDLYNSANDFLLPPFQAVPRPRRVALRREADWRNLPGELLRDHDRAELPSRPSPCPSTSRWAP